MHGRCSVLVQPRVVCISSIVLFIVAVVEMQPTAPVSRSDKGSIFRYNENSDEVDVIKQRILSDLGLSRVPDVSRAKVTPAKMDAMLELYKRSVEESEQEEEELGSEEEDEHTVMRFYSFPAKESSVEHQEIHHGTVIRQKLFFPLDTSPQLRGSKVSLKSAKLRIGGSLMGKRPRVLVYKLMDNSYSPNASRTLVTNHFVESNSSYLVDVDISDMVRTWLEEPSMNFGLVVELQNSTNDIKKLSVTASDQDAAVLDVLVSESPNRVKRSSPIPFNFSSETSLDCTQGLRTKMCCRRSLRLSFQEIGWDWILRPAVFETFYCKGKCHRDTNNFANTHALMQSILHQKTHRVPNPCCAPRKLKSMTLLHFDDRDPPELVVTKQKGMIVKECACT